MALPDPKVIDELTRLHAALVNAQASGKGVAEAEEAYREYAAWAATQGVTDGADAKTFADVLEDDDTDEPDPS